MAHLYDIVKYEIEKTRKSTEFIKASMLGYEKGITNDMILEFREVIQIIRIELEDRINDLLTRLDNKLPVNEKQLEELRKSLDSFIKNKFTSLTKQIEENTFFRCRTLNDDYGMEM